MYKKKKKRNCIAEVQLYKLHYSVVALVIRDHDVWRNEAPLSPIRFITMKKAGGRGSHTHRFCIHRHAVLCAFTPTNTQIKLPICMLAHTNACAYKDTYK